MGYLTADFFLQYLELRDIGRQALGLRPDKFAFSEGRSFLLAVTCEFLGFLDTSCLDAEGKRNVRREVARLAARYDGQNMDAVDAEYARGSQELNPDLLDLHVETITRVARQRHAAKQAGELGPKAAERLARRLMRHMGRVLRAGPRLGSRGEGGDRARGGRLL
jgi:hypothetical protein